MTLEKEYNEILREFESRDYSVDAAACERDLRELSSCRFLQGSAVSIFDVHKQKHIYESDYHKRMFSLLDGSYTGVVVHPDDRRSLLESGLAAFRHLFNNNNMVLYYKLLREYRAMVHGRCLRVTEQISVLETDSNGNIWLGLSVINLSANQSQMARFASQIVNTLNGCNIPAIERFCDCVRILTERETQILKLIAEGYLSKEIAARLGITENTVNTHRQHILQRLSVDTSIEAVRVAENLGLLDVSC